MCTAGKLKASELITFLEKHAPASTDSTSSEEGKGKGSSSTKRKTEGRQEDAQAEEKVLPTVVETVAVTDVASLADEEDARLLAFFAGGRVLGDESEISSLHIRYHGCMLSCGAVAFFHVSPAVQDTGSIALSLASVHQHC